MKTLTLSVLMFAFFSGSAAAREMTFNEWAYDYFVNGATLKLALGTRQAGIRVIRNSDKAEGRIVQRNEESYFLSYSTRPIFFSIENMGLTFVFNFSSFNAGQQEIVRDVFADLGTRASGEFYYVVPTVFYQWGDYTSGSYARVGIGLGAGVARFSGNVQLTDSAAQDIVSLSQGGASVTFASSFIAEAHWHSWGLTLNVAGPSYETDAFTYNVEDISVNLGYQFVF